MKGYVCCAVVDGMLIYQKHNKIKKYNITTKYSIRCPKLLSFMLEPDCGDCMCKLNDVGIIVTHLYIHKLIYMYHNII